MPFNSDAVRPEEKRIILATTDMNQTFPLKYTWAWDNYLQMMDNHWTPREIAVGPDVEDWKTDSLTPSERNIFLRVLAQLTTFDIQRGRDISESLMSHIDAPEIKQALIKQADQEALHTWSYQYIIENLGLDPDLVYNLYRTESQLFNRVMHAQFFSNTVAEIDRLELAGKEGKIKLLEGMVFWYLGFEGVWFYTDLAGPIQSLARRGKMRGAAEQFQYILRDEDLHVTFGVNLIKDFIKENSEVWDNNMESSIYSIMEEVLKLEEKFVQYVIEEPVLGYSVDDHMLLAKYFANNRLVSIGLEPIYPVHSCPLPWVEEMLLFRKEKNFFETRVTEYRTGGALLFGREQTDIDNITNWLDQGKQPLS